MSEDKEKTVKPRTFDSKDLQQFDGHEGRPLYVVFKGKVYDLSESRLWLGGKHMGMHTRDENLGETIKGAPHGEDTIARFPMLGEFGAVVPQPPTPLIVQKPVEKTVAAPLPPQGMERRTFLKLAAAAGGALTIMAIASTLKAATFIPKSTTPLMWPTINVANINQIQLLAPLTFNYPLTNTPNFLVKLGQAADGGVGPNQDIVAFSSVCQHLGCFYGFVAPEASPPCNAAFKAPSPEGYCCCHGSVYDFVHGARVVSGPAPRPLPQVQLQFDASTGNITAVGMGPPTIFGHGPPGTTDPGLVMQYDLQGGTVVS
jgi:arsenite oxidase small subunit